MQRLFASILFFLALTVTSVVLAKAPTSVKQSPAEKMKKKKKKDQPMKSTASIEKPQWGAGIRAGFLDSPVFSVGVQGYKILTDQDQIGLLLAKGSADVKKSLKHDASIQISRADLSASAFLLLGRHFWGDSFSVAYGMGERIIKGDLAAQNTSQDGGIATSIQVTSTVVHAAIGNIWKWDSGLFLGCDWIGTMVPLTSKSTVKTDAFGSGSAELDDVNERATAVAKEIGKITSITVLYLSVGMQF